MVLLDSFFPLFLCGHMLAQSTQATRLWGLVEGAAMHIHRGLACLLSGMLTPCPGCRSGIFPYSWCVFHWPGNALRKSYSLLMSFSWIVCFTIKAILQVLVWKSSPQIQVEVAVRIKVENIWLLRLVLAGWSSAWAAPLQPSDSDICKWWPASQEDPRPSLLLPRAEPTLSHSQLLPRLCPAMDRALWELLWLQCLEGTSWAVSYPSLLGCALFKKLFIYLYFSRLYI